jgi:hypothetical protein
MGGCAILSEKELKSWAWGWANRIHEAVKQRPDTPETAKLLDDWQMEVKKMVDDESQLDQTDYGAMLGLATTGYYEYLRCGGESEYLSQVKQEMERHRGGLP